MKITEFAGLLVLVGLFCGCANTSAARKEELTRVQMSLELKERQIRELEAALAQRELQVKEKDAQIQQLKDKLRSLGVF
jgi:septal ring factor EnvC (AmiA/AmiB activator)